MESVEAGSDSSLVNRLAAGVAHELRNPLAVILARVQLLQHGLQSGRLPEADKLARIFAAIEDQARRASTIVENLSVFAHPRAPELGPVDVEDVVSAALAALRPRLDNAGITADVDIAPEAGTIVADRAQLQAALGQLVVNAIEAMADGGRLHVRSRRSGGAVELSVADSGPGVAAEDTTRIFEAFFSTKRGAAGLGLCIAQTIAASHGGDLRLVRAGTPGAEFVLSLPASGR